MSILDVTRLRRSLHIQQSFNYILNYHNLIKYLDIFFIYIFIIEQICLHITLSTYYFLASKILHCHKLDFADFIRKHWCIGKTCIIIVLFIRLYNKFILSKYT